jgi:carbon storage regulator
MLVLRRRAHEAIVFEGGMLVTLLDVLDHRAWLAFSAASIPVTIVISSIAVGPELACIAVQSPVAVSQSERVTTVTIDDGTGGRKNDAVLLLNRAIGEEIVFPGLTLRVASLDQGRPVLAATVAELDAPVGVSVFSVSGAEVKIGIDAPDHIRVYREEVWLAMRSENERAATWTPGDLAELTSLPRPGTPGPAESSG